MLPCELAPEDMLPVEPAVDPAAVEPAVEPGVDEELPALSMEPRTSTFLFTYLSRSSLADALSLSPLLHWLEIELLPVVPAVLPVVVDPALLASATFVRMNCPDELELVEPAVEPAVDPVVPVAPALVPRSTQPVSVTFLLELL